VEKQIVGDVIKPFPCFHPTAKTFWDGSQHGIKVSMIRWSLATIFATLILLILRSMGRDVIHPSSPRGPHVRVNVRDAI